jgi:Ca-activated chloride channel family protein
MKWGIPDNFKWLWAAAAVYVVFWLLEWRKRRKLRRYGELRLIDQMSLSLDGMKRHWKQLMIAAALALIALALAKPQLPGKSVFVRKTGIDLVIAVDVSRSMLAEDVRPSRLEKAKLELQELVDKAKGDRIGVLAFAGEAFVQVPLTLDRNAVKIFLKTLSTDDIPVQGTAIGEAIRGSMSMFHDDIGESKVIVILTDGEDQGSDPIGAAKEAAKKGIRIYAIGIGTQKGEMIPVREGNGVSFKRDLKGRTVVSKLDEKTLEEITALTKGVYYRSQKGNLEMDRIYSDMRNLGKKETGSGWVTEPEPIYHYPLVAAVLLLLCEMIVSERRKE